MVPGYFRNVIFVSVAVIDSGTFKGADEVQALQDSVDAGLGKYVALPMTVIPLRIRDRPAPLPRRDVASRSPAEPLQQRPTR
jgi:hypothetical protein